ncbi:MAG TPA: LysM peptidoglycan-binding domain-containing protein [Polyangiaceae bacterium]|nr:LysM peptidoglycan-binding domain-containing protein [Polyangiaceae bacterium]
MRVFPTVSGRTLRARLQSTPFWNSGRAVIACVLWTLVSLLGQPTPALAFTHTVRTGDTLASIAEKYYGKIQFEHVLVAANWLDVEGGSSIVRGMRLEVPALSHRVIARGETWDALALELLGDERRSDVISMSNDSKPWLLPEEGAEIVVPYNLRLLVKPGDTLVSIAMKFMGDMNRAWVLAHYNRLEKNGLEPGSVILVPLTNLPLTEAGMKAAARDAGNLCSESAGASLKTQRRIAQEIPLLISDVRAGRYVEAIARGSRFIATGALTEPQLSVVHRQLLEAYVAVEATGLAHAACEEWKKRDPQAKLDPLEVSPKILRVCEDPKPNP